MPPHQLNTPARSSLREKGSRSQGKSVSFVIDLVPFRGPDAAPSALSQSSKPIEDGQNITIQSVTQIDDPTDINYTTTDEEEDEFKDEPYEDISPSESEDESEDGNSEEGSEEGHLDERDVYLAEREAAVRKLVFNPTRDLQRTPPRSPDNSALRSEIITVQRRKDPSNPVTILRRNMGEKLSALQRGQKVKVKISNQGSPQLQNTPDAQLRRQMIERDTPSGPAGSGFSSAFEDPKALFKARRNLNEYFTDDFAQTPAGPPPPFLSDDLPPRSPGSAPLKVSSFNIAFFFLAILSIYAFINTSEVLQGIVSMPRSIFYVVSNPKSAIPGISTIALAVPQYIICTIIACESASKSRLEIITMIATDTTIDLTSLSQFADLVTVIGRPLILNSAGNSLAEASVETASWRDSATIKTMKDLAHDYQDAHLDLRLMIGGSQNFVRYTTKKWADFSGFLTDQIPQGVRDGIDLPRGWTNNIPSVRKNYSAKALKTYYRFFRKEMVSSYQYIYSLMERSEKSLNNTVKRSREIHEAGVYESSGELKIVEPLLGLVREMRKHVAIQIKFFEADDEILGDSIGEGFDLGTLKWRMESLWASVTILQDTAAGRAIKPNTGKATIR